MRVSSRRGPCPKSGGTSRISFDAVLKMIFEWQQQPVEGLDSPAGALAPRDPDAERGGAGRIRIRPGVRAIAAVRSSPARRAACGACLACGWFSLGNHPDFRLIVPESMAPEPREEGAEPAKKKSEQIRIEQVRELADFLAVGTHRGGLRVILVYPAEAMNANTQNALLKNLENLRPPRFFFSSLRSPSACSDGAKPLPQVCAALPAARAGPSLARGAGPQAAGGDARRRRRCAACRAQGGRHGR